MERDLIARRMKALREERGLSQDQLAQMFGFKDRQIVSAIETGTRRVKAEELVVAVERLGVPLEFFIDPFRLHGEGRFSWRQTDVGVEYLKEQEDHAGKWLAAFRNLAPQVGSEIPFMRQKLKLNRRSSFEEAMEAGERFATAFDLGESPATRLREAMETQLGILVLMVDLTEGVSGASCSLRELDAVLIARREVAGRRHFDLAHELFHLLTWDAMPPEYAEESRETGGNRVEQLANNFAGALLMPEASVGRSEDWSRLDNDKLVSCLNAVADHLSVTSSALRWRLVALGKLKSGQAKAIPESALRNNGHVATLDELPDLFSNLFIDVMGKAIDQGLVSVRRMAELLDTPIEELEALFANHGAAHPSGL